MFLQTGLYLLYFLASVFHLLLYLFVPFSLVFLSFSCSLFFFANTIGGLFIHPSDTHLSHAYHSYITYLAAFVCRPSVNIPLLMQFLLIFPKNLTTLLIVLQYFSTVIHYGYVSALKSRYFSILVSLVLHSFSEIGVFSSVK